MLSSVTRRQMMDFIGCTPIFNWAICVYFSPNDDLFIQSEKYLNNWPATLRTVLSGKSRLSTETGWHFCHLSRAKMSHRAMVTSHIAWLASFTDMTLTSGAFSHQISGVMSRPIADTDWLSSLTLSISWSEERGRSPDLATLNLHRALVTGCWLLRVIITPFKIMRNDCTVL